MPDHHHAERPLLVPRHEGRVGPRALRRRERVRIPSTAVFRTKGEIALDLLKAAHRGGVPLGEVLLGDAEYGRLWDLRPWCREVGLRYGVGVHETQRVWDADGVWTAPMSAETYASFLAPADFRRIEWRTGANGQRLSARFAFLRVQVTEGKAEPVRGEAPEEWLVIEWRDGEAKPSHFYLCDVPSSWSRRAIVATLKERWRIERVHEDLKGEVRFDHFEGRSWPGWQHHATLARHLPDSLPSIRLRLGRRARERFLRRCPHCGNPSERSNPTAFEDSAPPRT